MFDVISFGEAMCRLSTTEFERFEQATNLKMDAGGAEANVVVGTARLGLQSAWVSLLPENALGYSVRNKIRTAGVDTSMVKFVGRGRMGLYWVEFGANPRRTKVLYDRKDSAISRIIEGDIDWNRVMKTRVFHTSGITPALSDQCKKATFDAVKAAKGSGALVSFDVNYRNKLWTKEEAAETIRPLMEYIDILITTEEDTALVFDITGDSYEEVARKIYDEYKCPITAITIRENVTIWKNYWTAIAFDGNRVYRDKKYDLEIVDRFGGGDSFSAGFIYGYLSKGDVQEALRYGNAFSALKHSNRTDFNWSSLQEVENLLEQDSLRVER